MISTTSFANHFNEKMLPSETGVVGLVDGLLDLCRSRAVRFVFAGSECVITDIRGDSQVQTAVPMKQSVFRAALARIAQLCNELAPGSVLPYGGTGLLVITSGDPVVFRAEFANTPEAQSLTVTPTGKSPDSEQSSLMELAVLELAKSGVSDPDVQLWGGLLRNDITSIRAAAAAGANVNVPLGEVFRRHSGSFTAPPLSDRLAAAALECLLRT